MSKCIIPKVMHFVWIGDESIRPDNCIETWRELNPDFDVKVWGNRELQSYNWRTKKHMDEMLDTGQIYGAVDMMRWEILFDHGGITVDADSICLNSLPEWLLSCDAFACWENELDSPGLITNCHFGAAPEDELVGFMVNKLESQQRVATKFSWRSFKRKRRSAWKVTGPQLLTNSYRDLKYTKLTILPSHFFIPRYTSGTYYAGSGPVICDHLFGFTKGSATSYSDLHKLTVTELRENAFPYSK